jgi:hypothetical protein
VKKKENFNDLDSLLERISYMLNGSDEKNVTNNISNQLNVMTESYRIYRLLEWCSDQPITCLKNPRIARFIYEGHLNIQAVYIRGLVSKQAKAISLRKILRYLEENKILLQRLEFVNSQKNGSDSERKHQAFDKISKNIHGRKDDDLISLAFIKELEDELNKCDVFSRFANTYCSHKLDKIGINAFEDAFPDFKLGLKEISKAHQALWSCFHRLNILFFDIEVDPNILSAHSFLHIDLPLVESVKKYENKLEELEKEVNETLKASNFI